MTKLCFHLWLLPQSYSRAKFELLLKCLQFAKLAPSITRDTSHDDRLVTLYRIPASPSIHCVGKTYLACICWNLRCYFTVLKLIMTLKRSHLTCNFHSWQINWGRPVIGVLFQHQFPWTAQLALLPLHILIWTENRHSPGTEYVLINNFSPLSKYVFKQLVKYALCVNTATDVIWSEFMTQSHNDTDVDVMHF